MKALAVGMLTFLGACYTWETIPPDARQLGRSNPLAITRVRITKLDGSEIRLEGASMDGDSVRGSPCGAKQRVCVALAKPIAIPRDSIRLMTHRKTDWGKTVPLFVVGLAAMAAGPK